MEIPRQVMIDAVVQAMTEDESQILTDLVRTALTVETGGYVAGGKRLTVLDAAIQSAASEVVRSRVTAYLTTGAGAEMIDEHVRTALSETAINDLVARVSSAITTATYERP